MPSLDAHPHKIFFGNQNTVNRRDLLSEGRASGVYVLPLIKAVAPRSVDMSQVTAGVTVDEKKLNARLAVSCARRAGCMVFALWEDIAECKPKMLLVLFATLMQLDVKSQAVAQSRVSTIAEE